MTTEYSKQIEHAQVDYVFKQLAVTGWPHAIAVTITAAMIWWDIGGLGIAVWFLVLQSSHVMRILVLDRLWQRYQPQEDYRTVKPFLMTGMLGTGFVWAAVPAFFMVGVETETFIFISIVIAGMVAATLPALAAYLPAYLLFAFPLLVVLTYRYFSLGMEAIGLLTLSYLAAVSVISLTINRIITQSITMDFKQRALLQAVTQAKEQAEQASLAKSEFLAAASHDLRQPLQAIGLILESLRLRLNGDKALDNLVQQGLRSHHALSDLFNALLELSRLESHKQEIHRSNFDLQPVVQGIVEEFKPMAAEKRLELSYQGSALVVDTDPVMFGRILRNLLTNAIKFTEQGSVRVRLAQPNDAVALEVIDTGIGIAGDDQKKIFHEYHQVSNKARRREEGLGLGLAVVRKICDLLAHTIELESQPGKGSTFRLLLPPGELSNTTTDEKPISFDVSGLKVLVVDDDIDVLKAVSGLLQDWGCSVEQAAGIDTVLQLIEDKAYKPDLILSDYRLAAESSGIDVIEAARSRLQVRVPGVLMSGDTDPDVVSSIRERGYFLLQKPIKPVQLRKVMKRLTG